jgi:tetratricopeptide (TPR) repeat protein
MPKGRALLVCLALGLLTLLVYVRGLGHEFIEVYDDATYITENIRIHDGPTLDAVRWAFTSAYAANWHPLTWLSHMLDCRLFGLDPAGHHAVSVLLHVANSLLLCVVLQRMTGAFWRSAIVAALFAVHPLHVESVAWVAERKDVLSTSFWLLTVWAYGAWTARPSAARYALILALYAAGLMAKPMLVTLPCALLLLDVWPLLRAGRLGAAEEQGAIRQGPGLRRLLLEKAPLFAMSAGAAVATFFAQRLGGAVADFEAHPLALRVQNAVVAYAAYLGKTVWPVDLAVIYPYPAAYPVWKVAASAALLLLVSAVAAWRARRTPAGIVGWLWFLGTLVPVIGLVQVGAQSMADRYTYIPHIGLFVALVWGADALVRRFQGLRLPLAALAAAALLLLSALTVRQVGLWHSGVTLFSHALAVTRDNYIAHTNLGSALIARGEVAQAVPHFHRAVSIDPGYVIARSNLGAALVDLGRIDEGLPHLMQAVEEAPGDAQSHVNLANALARREDWSAAAEHFQRAIELDPDSIAALVSLAQVRIREGRFADAAALYASIVRRDPDQPLARTNLGMLLLDHGRYEEAYLHLSIAARLQPDAADVHFALGKAQAGLGDHAAAAEHYRRALELEPQDVEAVVRLGDACARLGRAAEAAQLYRQALDKRPGLPAAQIGLAWLSATSTDSALRDGSRAEELAGQASTALGHRDPHALDVLAAAHAEAGRFDEALRVAALAQDAALAAGRSALLAGIRARMEAYRARRPWRE